MAGDFSQLKIDTTARNNNKRNANGSSNSSSNARRSNYPAIANNNNISRHQQHQQHPLGRRAVTQLDMAWSGRGGGGSQIVNGNLRSSSNNGNFRGNNFSQYRSKRDVSAQSDSEFGEKRPHGYMPRNKMQQVRDTHVHNKAQFWLHLQRHGEQLNRAPPPHCLFTTYLEILSIALAQSYGNASDMTHVRDTKISSRRRRRPSERLCAYCPWENARAESCDTFPGISCMIFFSKKSENRSTCVCSVRRFFFFRTPSLCHDARGQGRE